MSSQYKEPGPTKTGRGPRRPGIRQVLLAPTGQISIATSRVESLAKSLETRMRRDKFHTVDEVTLRVGGPIINLLHIRNLLTRLAPERSIDIRLNTQIRRSKSPQYSLAFDLSKQDAATEEGRSLLDMSWRKD